MYFTPFLRFFSPFPHGTGSLSVFREYLALPDGPGRFRQGSTCLAVLRIPLSLIQISYTGLAPSMVGLSMPFYYSFQYYVAVLQPRIKFGLGCSHFARHYFGNHYCFLFLQVLRCFNSLSCLTIKCNKTLLLLGYPIRRSTDLCSCTTPRSISLFIASFIRF